MNSSRRVSRRSVAGCSRLLCKACLDVLTWGAMLRWTMDMPHAQQTLVVPTHGNCEEKLSESKLWWQTLISTVNVSPSWQVDFRLNAWDNHKASFPLEYWKNRTLEHSTIDLARPLTNLKSKWVHRTVLCWMVCGFLVCVSSLWRIFLSGSHPTKFLIAPPLTIYGVLWFVSNSCLWFWLSFKNDNLENSHAQFV